MSYHRLEDNWSGGNIDEKGGTSTLRRLDKQEHSLSIIRSRKWHRILKKLHRFCYVSTCHLMIMDISNTPLKRVSRPSGRTSASGLPGGLRAVDPETSALKSLEPPGTNPLVSSARPRLRHLSNRQPPRLPRRFSGGSDGFDVSCPPPAIFRSNRFSGHQPTGPMFGAVCFLVWQWSGTVPSPLNDARYRVEPAEFLWSIILTNLTSLNIFTPPRRTTTTSVLDHNINGSIRPILGNVPYNHPIPSRREHCPRQHQHQDLSGTSYVPLPQNFINQIATSNIQPRRTDPTPTQKTIHDTHTPPSELFKMPPSTSIPRTHPNPNPP